MIEGKISRIVRHFSEKIAGEQGNTPKQFSDKAIKLLQEYDWTGNIRELRNVVEPFNHIGRKRGQ